MNPHKKGEHVFNDIAGSFENAINAALTASRANSLILSGPHGPLRLSDFPSTTAGLRKLQKDPILTEARTVVAPATGNVSDNNSRIYGDAKAHFEGLLRELVSGTAALLWKKKPRSRGTYREFDDMVVAMRDTRLLVNDAKSAFGALVDVAYDEEAEVAALAELASDTELLRRKAAIDAMKAHLETLKETGSTLVDTFAMEVERVLERRIGAA
jgi:hypothetical protein